MTRSLRLSLIVSSLVVSALWMSGCAGAQSELRSEPVVTPFDEGAVLAILQDSAAAWSRGDLDAFVSVYADDCLFMTPAGLTRGKQKILERYRQRYPDRQAMGALQLEVLETRTAPPNGIAVAARWVLSYPDQPASSGHTLVIFRHLKGGWKIVQDASM